MGLGLQRDDTLDIFHAEVVAGRLVGRCELLDHRALCEGHIVLIGRQYLVRILQSGLLDHLEEARLHFLTVDDERTAEDFVAAVLRVDLCETEDLRVGQRPAVLLLNLVQVLHLLGRECQSLLLVILLKIFDVLDGLGLDIHGEDVLVQSVVHALQHLVVLSILAANREILLDALNAFQSHVLGDFHGVRAPGSDHLAARTDKETLQFLCLFYCGIAVQPTKFVDLVLIELVVYLGSNDALLGGSKKKNHTDIICCFDFCLQIYTKISNYEPVGERNFKNGQPFIVYTHKAGWRNPNSQLFQIANPTEQGGIIYLLIAFVTFPFTFMYKKHNKVITQILYMIFISELYHQTLS